MITPRIFKINGALLEKIDDYAPYIQDQRGFIGKKLMITPRISKINGALLEKIDDYAPHIQDQRGFIGKN